MHWTGHTGCVILAPHLVGMKKKDLWACRTSATPPSASARRHVLGERRRSSTTTASAFKIACRDHRGVMVTIIADNYFGYCKKEVKTQISFAANLYGLCEEEHAGGAIAFATYVLGQDFYADRTVSLKKATLRRGHAPARRSWRSVKPEGYAVDRRYPDILYVPEDAEFNVREGCVQWRARRRSRSS